MEKEEYLKIVDYLVEYLASGDEEEEFYVPNEIKTSREGEENIRLYTETDIERFIEKMCKL